MSEHCSPRFYGKGILNSFSTNKWKCYVVTSFIIIQIIAYYNGFFETKSVSYLAIMIFV